MNVSDSVRATASFPECSRLPPHEARSLRKPVYEEASLFLTLSLTYLLPLDLSLADGMRANEQAHLPVLQLGHD